MSKTWEWPVNTVGKLIANLQTLPPEMPFYTAYFVEIDGEKVTRCRTPSLSYETTDGFKVEKYREDDKSLVMWASAAPLPEEKALAPQESPLAWAVFIHLDPQGFDYRIFPDEQDAADVSGENPENSEPVPLYRTSAFSPQKPLVEDRRDQQACALTCLRLDCKLECKRFPTKNNLP